jgi:hypothetical protein
MAKFALRRVAQSMARELGPPGIHVAHFVIDGLVRQGTGDREPDQPDAWLDAGAIAATYLHVLRLAHRSYTSAASEAREGPNGRDGTAKFPRSGTEWFAVCAIRGSSEGGDEVGPMPPTCRIQSWDQPPSTGSSAPLVKVASNARKRTALAISSDVPKRFIGIMPSMCSLI